MGISPMELSQLQWPEYMWGTSEDSFEGYTLLIFTWWKCKCLHLSQSSFSCIKWRISSSLEFFNGINFWPISVARKECSSRYIWNSGKRFYLREYFVIYISIHEHRNLLLYSTSIFVMRAACKILRLHKYSKFRILRI